MERDERWAENLSEIAIMHEDKARYRGLALQAKKSRASSILKVMEVEVAKRMLEAGNGNDQGEPKTIEDVFEAAARKRIEQFRIAANGALDVTPENGSGEYVNGANGTTK
jgi:hypothetical protein